MAKKKVEQAAETEDKTSSSKKRGLFSFFRRKPKNDKLDQSDTKPDETGEAASLAPDELDEAQPEVKKTRKKAPAKAKKSRAKSATSTKASSRKTAAKTQTKTSTKQAAQPKKRGRPRKEKVVEEADIPAENKAVEEGDIQEAPKKRLFGLLKPKKAKPAADADDKSVAKKESAEEEKPKKVKKGLFGFLRRSKKVTETEAKADKEKSADDGAIDAQLAMITGIDASGNATNEQEVQADDAKDSGEDGDVAPKKSKFGFLKKKIVIILLAAFGVTGASGAAAIVFVGPMFSEDVVKTGLACDVVHRAEFELMKENRVTAFLRSDFLLPKERIQLLIQYTKFLQLENPQGNLFTVSLLDTNGPTHRSEFRGQNIGAQLVYAPEPLLSHATNQKWEIRYVQADGVSAGKFIGDRYTLSQDEIDELNDESLVAADCYQEPEEGEEEEIAEEGAEGEEASEDGDAAPDANSDEMAGDEMAEGDEALEEEPAEPGFIDNMLSMVGLGGSEDEASEDTAEGEASTDDMPDHTMFPGDRQSNADVMEAEAGFFDGILSMVGLGADAENPVAEILKPDVLGTKVSYD